MKNTSDIENINKNIGSVKTVSKDFFRLISIIFAAMIMALNIKNFIRPCALLPGGFNGITLLLQRLFLDFFDIKIAFSIINLPLNAVPALICFKYIGKRFTVFSCIMIFFTSIFTDLVPIINITDDIILCAIFGGIINAISISICLLSHATSGGTDFISIFIAEKYNKDAWNYIFFGNVIVLTISGIIFGIEGAMYSIILQFVSTAVIQQIYKRYQKETLLIITEKTHEIYAEIKKITNHDGTVFKGIGLYKGNEHDMIYSVISRDESNLVIKKIKQVDPHAFINIMKSEQIQGNFYKRPNI